MKKILVYSPDPHDGISYFRLWGPLSLMRDKVSATGFPSATPSEIYGWHWYLNYDIALVNRPYRPQDLAFIQRCKLHKMPVWIDWDDALFNVTRDNPSYLLYTGEQTLKIMLECLKLADVVTVSSKLEQTKFLGDETFKLKNVIHLPIALDDRLLPQMKNFQFDFERRFSWRGSQFHLADLLYFEEKIGQCLENTRKNTWVFFGMNPFWHEWHMEKPNFKYAPIQNVKEFYHSLCEWNAHIQMVPLIDTYFNRVKSHLAWIDATIAGSVCLGPNFEEWQDKPGLSNYSEKDNFVYNFSKLIDSSDHKLDSLHKNSKQWMLDNILLSYINNKRMEIINNL